MISINRTRGKSTPEIKGIIDAITNDSVMPDSHRYSLNRFIWVSIRKISSFLSWKVLDSETRIENNQCLAKN